MNLITILSKEPLTFFRKEYYEFPIVLLKENNALYLYESFMTLEFNGEYCE